MLQILYVSQNPKQYIFICLSFNAWNTEVNYCDVNEIAKKVRFIWDKVIRFEKYFLQVLFSQY